MSISTGRLATGSAAARKLLRAGLLNGASTYVRTPSGGVHVYFAGLAAALWPPGRPPPGLPVERRFRPGPAFHIEGRIYQVVNSPGGHGGLDWGAVVQLLEPQKQQQRSPQPESSGQDLTHLARWVASQPEGNRNAGLFWAANRALEADPAADLSPLTDAARRAGLGDLEITRTLNSARRTDGSRLGIADYQPKAGDHT